ncbi:MAG: hypothetical protein KF768_11755 [Phycisphaeraceae bacterium]|nr:hypothetical protein [Phycisphaeraceae bacterium]
MKKVVKILAALILVFVLLLVGAVVAVGYFVDDIAKKGIEQGGTHALGVQTTLDKASVGLFSGKFGLKGLKVANPDGFSAPAFFSLGEGGVAVDYGSLQQPVVTLPELRLADIGVSLEKKGGKSNYEVILASIKKLQSDKPADPSPAPAPTGDEKKFVVNQLSIRNVRVDVDLVEAGPIGQLAKISIPIESIELSNVGQTGTGVKGTGVSMEQLLSIIVQAVLSAAMENSGGRLPADFVNDLKGQLATLDGLKDLPMKIAGDAGKALQDAGKDAADKAKQAADEARKAAEDAAKKVGDGIKGIGDSLPIPGGKK